MQLAESVIVAELINTSTGFSVGYLVIDFSKYKNNEALRLVPLPARDYPFVSPPFPSSQITATF